MFKIMLFSLILMLSISFIQMIHPLAIAITLLFQTLLSITLMGSLMSSFWFSYITFLIFIGGVLILFTYITSISSNEMFFFSSKFFVMIILSTITVFLLIIYLYMHDFSSLLKSSDKTIFNPVFDSMNNLFLLKIFHKPTSMMTIFLVMYLFLALMVVSKIINTSHGPLRQNLN
uniref:NADH-ubiquinone oxidoreductase chain 6 n=2 Tax=Tridactylidae TaxID=58551 RepID=A0A1J0M4K5_9ORTH|nr:NADH dehydrogenase subunit 6 [Xya japonica]APD14940.1 NADH dehydrogenase subunit 6 [Tridactylus sp. NS-2016]